MSTLFRTLRVSHDLQHHRPVQGILRNGAIARESPFLVTQIPHTNLIVAEKMCLCYSCDLSRPINTLKWKGIYETKNILKFGKFT